MSKEIEGPYVFNRINRNSRSPNTSQKLKVLK